MSMSTVSRYSQPSAPWPATSSRKNGACRRLPISRPCMSVMTRSTVSIAPASTSVRNSSSVSIGISRWWFAEGRARGHSYTACGMDRNRPLIGISAYRLPADFSHWRGVESVLVPAGYVEGVVRAGGLPLVLPPVDERPEDALDVLDGLVLVGGADVNPAVYGQEPHPEALAFADERDRAELALLRGALARDLPLLGICRGMQLLNIAAGGDLHQHIPEITPDPAAHKAGPGKWARHEVSVAPGCRLADLIGDRPTVVSAHHQA